VGQDIKPEVEKQPTFLRYLIKMKLNLIKQSKMVCVRVNACSHQV